MNYVEYLAAVKINYTIRYCYNTFDQLKVEESVLVLLVVTE